MPYEYTCRVCGRVRESLYPSHAKRKYCSRSCQHASLRRSLSDKFWPQVEKGDGCWLWIGARTYNGYGYCAGRGAHRLSWELHHGPIQKGLLVCHKCDNPPCVRPDHLFLGTPRDNTQDSLVKGRSRPGLNLRHKKGQAHPYAKLTEEQVREIRSRFVPYRVSQYKLAQEFGVSRNTIQRIIERRSWTHI